MKKMYSDYTVIHKNNIMIEIV